MKFYVQIEFVYKMKMKETKQADMLEFLKNENDYITYLLEAFEVPETIDSKLKALRKHIGCRN